MEKRGNFCRDLPDKKSEKEKKGIDKKEKNKYNKRAQGKENGAFCSTSYGEVLKWPKRPPC